LYAIRPCTRSATQGHEGDGTGNYFTLSWNAVTREDSKSCGLSFNRDHSKSFRDRRKKQNVRGFHQPRDIVTLAEEPDTVIQSTRGNRTNRFFERCVTPTGNEKPDVRFAAGERSSDFESEWMILLIEAPIQSSHEKHDLRVDR
jgi:hypothetical protein